MVRNIFLLSFVFASLLTEICSFAVNLQQYGFIKDLARGKNRNILPPEQPVNVNLSLVINTISHIRAKESDYQVHMILKQKWLDSRLSYSNKTYQWLDLSIVSDNVWQPRTTFANAKDGSVTHLTVKSVGLWGYPNGTVESVHRLRLVLHCRMNMAKFPFDTQYCPILIDSLDSKKQEMILKIDNQAKSIFFSPDIHVTGFERPKKFIRNCTSGDASLDDVYIDTNKPCVAVWFSLKRDYSYYLLSLYLPQYILVAVSWTGFWIDSAAAPARVTLALVTLLSVLTQSMAVQRTDAHLDYLRAVDTFNLVCIVFVVLALLEFTSVSFSRHKKAAAAAKFAKYKSVATTSSENSAEVETKTKFNCGDKLTHLDTYSRVIFPITFFLTQIVYYLIIYSLDERKGTLP